MKKTFRLEDLECANCAAKIEKAVNDLPEVTNATVNFMTTKMVIESDSEDWNSIIKQVKKIIKKHEPDVTLKEL